MKKHVVGGCGWDMGRAEFPSSRPLFSWQFVAAVAICVGIEALAICLKAYTTF